MYKSILQNVFIKSSYSTLSSKPSIDCFLKRYIVTFIISRTIWHFDIFANPLYSCLDYWYVHAALAGLLYILIVIFAFNLVFDFSNKTVHGCKSSKCKTQLKRETVYNKVHLVKMYVCTIGVCIRNHLYYSANQSAVK